MPGARLGMKTRRLLVSVAASARLEDAPYLVSKLLRRERFADELRLTIEDAMANDRLFGGARHEQHPRGRPRPGENLRQLAPTHSRHHDIRDEQVDRPIEGVGERESLVPARGLEHLVAKVAQDASDELSHHHFVLDEKQRLRPPSLSERSDRSFRFGALLGDGKVNAKHASPAYLAGDLDRAVRLLHDAVHRCCLLYTSPSPR